MQPEERRRRRRKDERRANIALSLSLLAAVSGINHSGWIEKRGRVFGSNTALLTHPFFFSSLREKEYLLLSLPRYFAAKFRREKSCVPLCALYSSIA